MFNPQPTHLANELVRLEILQATDFERLYAVASDPLVWEVHPNPDRYKRDVFLTNFFEGAVASGSALVMIEQATGNVMGSSRYYKINEELKEIYVGYTFLGRNYWGGAFNKVVKQLMLDYAFESFETVLFEIGINNFRSRKAVEKIGGQLVGEVLDEEKPHVVYAIKKADWKTV